MRLSTVLFFPLISACTTAPQTAIRAPGRYIETFDSGGKSRKFILRVPRDYDGTKSLPLVMVLHGWTASAEEAEVYTRMGAKADKEGFVAVFPDGLGEPGYQGWNAGFIDLTGSSHPNDVAFLTTVLDRVEGEVKIDKDREFVVGHSNGAFMANTLGSRLGNRLAAIASMAGTVGLDSKNKIPAPVSPVSVMLLHGKADRMVAYQPEAQALLRPIGAVDSAKFWAAADGCSPTPSTTQSPNGKVVTDRYSGGKDGTEVVLVSVADGPHDWWGGVGRSGDVPTYGAPVDDLSWDFFRTHPKHR